MIQWEMRWSRRLSYKLRRKNKIYWGPNFENAYNKYIITVTRQKHRDKFFWKTQVFLDYSWQVFLISYNEL